MSAESTSLFKDQFVKAGAISRRPRTPDRGPQFAVACFQSCPYYEWRNNSEAV